MKKTFELEWNDDLGKGWMNIFNLELCLYSKECTKRELVKVKEIKSNVEKQEVVSDSEKEEVLSITLNEVKSSNIASVGYDESHLTLRVKFKSGAVYDYSNVSKDKFAELMRAESTGKFFCKEIRGVYTYKKVEILEEVKGNEESTNSSS